MPSSSIPLGEASLVSLYFSYKRSTKKALDWLLSTADGGRGNAAFRNTAEIVEAAYRVKEKQLKVPEDVISNFRMPSRTDGLRASCTPPRVGQAVRCIRNTRHLSTGEGSEEITTEETNK